MLPACSDGVEEPPTRLVDGSMARTSQIAFEGVDAPVLVTRARRGSNGLRCGVDDARDAILVERVGVAGASVTAHSTRARALYACDRTATGGWCGQAFARLPHSAPLDPRLSLTCESAEGDAVGFMWIYPRPDTRYVVAEHGDYAEAYEVIARAPVRVTTNDVDVTTSTARLDVSEHAADGRRLDAYLRVAQVAG